LSKEAGVGFSEKLFRHAIARAYDLYQAPIDRWQVHVRRRHKRVFRETAGERTEAAPGRLAIVAIYPSDDSLPFTLNLLDALTPADPWILVVSTRRLTAAQLAALTPRAHHIIERDNVGRDFGSYSFGIEWLERHRPLRSAELLILANDTMFYPKAFAAELQLMLQRPAAWQALFDSNEIVHHAQSFFLLFRGAVLRSELFWKFWRQYRPYSTRVHAVRQGEMELSKVLKTSGFGCEAAYSSVRVAQALAKDPIPLPEFSELVPSADHTDVSTREVLSSAIELELTAPVEPAPQYGLVAPATPQEELAGSAEPRRRGEELLWELWSFRTVQEFEGSNPSHVGGLLCNRLFGAPIRRDICYRGLVDIHQILRCAIGFSEMEMAAMERDVRARGLGARVGGLSRMLFETGRI
jgi:Rhamnan synthesis protein F